MYYIVCGPRIERAPDTDSMLRLVKALYENSFPCTAYDEAEEVVARVGLYEVNGHAAAWREVDLSRLIKPVR